MLLFHGTTMNRFQKIIKDGFIGSNDHVWNVSMPETTYFYTETFCREESEDQWYQEGVRRAMESAECALAQESSNLKRVVLIFKSEDIEQLGELEKDDSSENMDYCVQFKGKIPIDKIYEVYYDRTRLDGFSLYFRGFAHSRDDERCFPYIQLEDENIDDIFIEATKQLYNSLCGWWMENMNDPELLIRDPKPTYSAQQIEAMRCEQ